MNDVLSQLEGLAGDATARVAEIDQEIHALRAERSRLISIFRLHDGRASGTARQKGFWPERILEVFESSPETELRAGEVLRRLDGIGVDTNGTGDLQRVRQTVYAALNRMSIEGTLEKRGLGLYALASKNGTAG